MDKKVTAALLDKHTIALLDKLTINAISVKQEPYVGEDGIYVPCEAYVPEGCSAAYKCIITKELFVEAYNKWIKEGE